ncbi:MAG: response regulator transcription factor [Clostridiales bacterium]|nr:response regulator transcription factor [Clostridiales bacterium]
MIYYVEDDESIRELVVYTLRQMGMEIRGFAEADAFHAAMKEALPELVLLDIMLPGEDGLSILRGLRGNPATADVPVILITAKDTEYDVVKGLDHGADDYIAKPFGMAELAARVRARLRRSKPAGEDQLLFGALVMDRRAHSVSVQGEKVSLTLKEYELLRILMENAGTAFTREHLLERIWDYAYDGGTRTVDVHVQTLRAKLGPCGDMIETVRGVGYRFGGGRA